MKNKSRTKQSETNGVEERNQGIKRERNEMAIIDGIEIADEARWRISVEKQHADTGAEEDGGRERQRQWEREREEGGWRRGK